MFLSFLTKYFWILALIALPLIGLSWRTSNQIGSQIQADQVNLALRRTADGLLRAGGDSLSRIPAIEQKSERTWLIKLTQPFNYDLLPKLLDESLQLQQIHQPYQVKVRRCDDDTIDLGYHINDLKNDDQVPCGGREAPTGCHYIEVDFMTEASQESMLERNWLALALSLMSCSMIGLGLYLNYRKQPLLPSNQPSSDDEIFQFADTSFNFTNQSILHQGTAQQLTYREAKLLRVFASHPNQLLERDHLIQQVWADEGVLVGRSLDMFVSRLRKKMAADQSLGITAVHGLGYRFEVGREVVG
jgi:DNA-binding winged helix-turn-helix (wHTH) protein